MFRRQANITLARQRLLQSERQAVLVAAGDQREPGRRTDGGIGVGLGEAYAARGDAVDVWGGVLASAIAGEVGITEVVGHDEDDVGLHGTDLPVVAVSGVERPYSLGQPCDNDAGS